jgi:proliferating cell nuclear antigen PCNA
MEDDKLIEVVTGHAFIFTKLIDVLNQNLTEITIQFIQDIHQNAKIEDTYTYKDKEKDEESETEMDAESESADESETESDDESESEPEEVKKPINKKEEKERKKREKEKAKKKKEKEKIKKKKEKEKLKEKEKKKKDKTKKNEKHYKEPKDDEPEVEEPKNNGGMRIIAIDEQKTILIYVKLPSEQFDKFYVKKSSHSIGVNLELFYKFMKTVDKNSLLTMSIDKDDEQTLVLRLEDDEKPCYTEFRQKLLDLNDEQQKLPREKPFDMAVRMKTSEFKKVCSEMNIFSEYVEITCTINEITFKCHGDSSNFSKTYKNSELGVIIYCTKKNVTEITEPVMVQAIFNLKHLVTFGKCVNLCEELVLFLRNDWPLFINYTIGRLGKMLVGVAPVDDKTLTRETDYDGGIDKYYDKKNIIMKDKDEAYGHGA